MPRSAFDQGNQCKITGCDLWIEEENKWLHGDLFYDQGVWILNGNWLRGKAEWEYGGEMRHPDERYIAIEKGMTYFERKGVVVFKDGVLSPGAENYIERGGTYE